MPLLFLSLLSRPLSSPCTALNLDQHTHIRRVLDIPTLAHQHRDLTDCVHLWRQLSARYVVKGFVCLMPFPDLSKRGSPSLSRDAPSLSLFQRWMDAKSNAQHANNRVECSYVHDSIAFDH